MRAAVEEFTEAQQNQERMRGVLQDSGEVSTMPLWNPKKKARCGLEDAGERITEKKKRKPTMPTTKSGLIGIDVDGATMELVSDEDDLKDSLGRMGQLVKDTAGATHALRVASQVVSRTKPATSEKRLIQLRISEERVHPRNRRGHFGGASKISSLAEEVGKQSRSDISPLGRASKKKFTYKRLRRTSTIA